MINMHFILEFPYLQVNTAAIMEPSLKILPVPRLPASPSVPGPGPIYIASAELVATRRTPRPPACSWASTVLRCSECSAHACACTSLYVHLFPSLSSYPHPSGACLARGTLGANGVSGRDSSSGCAAAECRPARGTGPRPPPSGSPGPRGASPVCPASLSDLKRQATAPRLCASLNSARVCTQALCERQAPHSIHDVRDLESLSCLKPIDSRANLVSTNMTLFIDPGIKRAPTRQLAGVCLNPCHRAKGKGDSLSVYSFPRRARWARTSYSRSLLSPQRHAKGAEKQRGALALSPATWPSLQAKACSHFYRQSLTAQRHVCRITATKSI